MVDSSRGCCRTGILIALVAMFVGCQADQPEKRRPTPLTTYDAQADALLAKMTLEEKVGQMMQPDQGSLKSPEDIEKYFLGSLLSGGGSGPKNKAEYTFDGWTRMVEGYQQHALKTRLAIPLLYGIDAVHGHNNIPGATLFPHNIGLGCTRNPELIEKIARITAQEVRATNINWAFGPCVTVPQDIRWGRTYEGYSSDPEIVKPLGGAAVRGLQGASLDQPLSVVASAKHFVGDGGTAFGSAGRSARLDQGDTRVDEATLRRVHLPGYYAAIEEGVATIMPSYSSWNGVKCTGNKYLLTDVLKKEMGFEGFLISDYNAVDQISPDYPTSVATAINAGIDMVMMTDKYPRFYETLLALVRDGKVPQSRIDDAVRRILRVKIAAGLMAQTWSPKADPTLKESFGSAGHRDVARQAVRESLVLLKNDSKTLPLSKTTRRIHLSGRGADNLGMQCGGWTLDWQGKMQKDVPGGTSVLTAFRSAVAKDCEVTYSLDGAGAEAADVNVVVVGESPYAEGKGDTASPVLTEEDNRVIQTAKATGKPVVLILFSGRPLLLGTVMNDADAIVAAWLPGSEGAGITDVLFGTFQPTGKLSYAWPVADQALPIGFGLGYHR